MIRHNVDIIVKNALAEQFYEFMINPNDKKYNESGWNKNAVLCNFGIILLFLPYLSYTLKIKWVLGRLPISI